MRRILMAVFITATIMVSPVAADPTSPTPADTGFGSDVLTISSYNSDLVVGGKFFSAGGVTAGRIAGWNGASWYGMLGLPLGPEVYAIKQLGVNLLVGTVLPDVYQWDGAAWSMFGTSLGTQGSIFALEEFNGQLIAAGSFRFGPVDKIAAWNGASWDSLGLGIFGAGWTVYDLMVFNGDLIVAGSFSKAGGDTALAIARWDGSTWSPFGAGLWGPLTVQSVFALAEYNGDLIAAGLFSESGTQTRMNVARWNGITWRDMGVTPSGVVYALTVYNNQLIAGGRFLSAGAQLVYNVASYDGFSWNPMGAGVDSTVRALAVHDGSLIAGGAFPLAGGGYVAAWDGASWVPVSSVITDAPDDEHDLLPKSFSLDQNYPNPFNPSTTIDYSLPTNQHVTITIYNSLGQTVRKLVDREQPTGRYSVTWDANDDHGRSVATGVYLYKLTAGDKYESRKMLLLK